MIFIISVLIFFQVLQQRVVDFRSGPNPESLHKEVTQLKQEVKDLCTINGRLKDTNKV